MTGCLQPNTHRNVFIKLFAIYLCFYGLIPDIVTYARAMIVLSQLEAPTDGVRFVQPQVEAYIENDCAGLGTLTISER
jgi:hypothetical protein